MKKIIVIGAGASGMLAAISAARQGASVTLLEGMEKPGKKLLITGSGRCNLTNLRQEPQCYRGADAAFTWTVLQQFPVQDTLAFFREIGLLTTARDGYVYPVTGQASSVLEVLLLEMKRLGVKLKCTEKVISISKHAAAAPDTRGGQKEQCRSEEQKRRLGERERKTEDRDRKTEEQRRQPEEQERFYVQTAGWTYEADAVILSAGSRALPATGSDGSGYALAKGCGHSLVPPREALVPLIIREGWIKKLSGLRMQAAVSLDGHTELGELQWTDTGISGIVVFQLSRYAVRALAKQPGIPVQLDLLPSVSETELYTHLTGICALQDGRSAENLLAGMFAKKAATPLLQAAKITPSQKAGKLDRDALHRLVGTVKKLTLTVSGYRSFEQAQVCQGGVLCSEVHPQTLESRKMPGLYLTGELLDVDGICGGYNLQWAWSSGFTAGRAAANSPK